MYSFFWCVVHLAKRQMKAYRSGSMEETHFAFNIPGRCTEVPVRIHSHWRCFHSSHQRSNPIRASTWGAQAISTHKSCYGNRVNVPCAHDSTVSTASHSLPQPVPAAVIVALVVSSIATFHRDRFLVSLILTLAGSVDEATSSIDTRASGV